MNPDEGTFSMVGGTDLLDDEECVESDGERLWWNRYDEEYDYETR
jgi:hypothetical protein